MNENNNNGQPMTEAEQQKQLSEQVRIRREKLAELQSEGKDPFVI